MCILYTVQEFVSGIEKERISHTSTSSYNQNAQAPFISHRGSGERLAACSVAPVNATDLNVLDSVRLVEEPVVGVHVHEVRM